MGTKSTSRKPRRRGPLGAATDSPLEMAKRAIEEAERAPEGEEQNLTLRRAAELGWLAASSTADVLAVQTGESAPQGFNARKAVLERTEREAGLKRGSLVAKLGAAKEVLHGACFHGDRCDRTVVLAVLEDDVKAMAELAEKVKAKLKRGKR